jgi:hypothetical protein
LKACRLVCRAWLPSAANHLFKAVSLVQHHHDPTNRTIPTTICEFRELIQSPLCTIGTSVRQLTLSAYPREKDFRDGCNCVSQILSYIDNLSNVNCLRFVWYLPTQSALLSSTISTMSRCYTCTTLNSRLSAIYRSSSVRLPILPN